jgi:hypothetical protein
VVMAVLPFSAGHPSLPVLFKMSGILRGEGAHVRAAAPGPTRVSSIDGYRGRDARYRTPAG